MSRFEEAQQALVAGNPRLCPAEPYFLAFFLRRHRRRKHTTNTN